MSQERKIYRGADGDRWFLCREGERVFVLSYPIRCGAKEDAMPITKKPLNPDDFPVNADGKKIEKQDGTPIANTDDPAVAADVAERLNEDEAWRQEDKWSA